MALLSWSPTGLQQLLDSMQIFCQQKGLTISAAKTEVVVFNDHQQSQSFWHVGGQPLPQSESFKYLGLIFHQSGSMSQNFQRLKQNGTAARVRLAAQYKGLQCDKSFPMMKRLFDAVVFPTCSYGCEVWGTHCGLKARLSLPKDVKPMADIQISFFRHICQLRKSIPPEVIFSEFNEIPWVIRWWQQMVGFMNKLMKMPAGSLHTDILRDNI